ncbi:MAG TPA: 50S ribosomal protein L17 [Bacteroidales bacterium]|nr:50S ribosomal protein L17 [Bacteroidales bacterium]HRR93266.1 50S ribosomal protein L17 [Bacteroidales bacterium]HRT88613.1 50S ribosomal protein L17 [Bacteroidales bacterium]
MRHQRVINHLGRTSAHRKAMLANMAASLIMSKRIKTTTAKARALRTYIEPLITKSKEDSTHSRRMVFSHLQNKEAVSELFRTISPKVAERPGGYTRILKTGNRIGDNAEMCIIELVDFNEAMLGTETKTKTAARRRRSPKKKTAGQTTGAAEAATTDTASETTPQEEPAKEQGEESK